MLEAGLPAVNICSAEGLAEELFTYAGSGTLFTRDRYMSVRRLGIDDFDAAHDLIHRGWRRVTWWIDPGRRSMPSWPRGSGPSSRVAIWRGSAHCCPLGGAIRVRSPLSTR